MSFTKTYFLCPISDFIHPPPAGPLCLGSIIRSTTAPQHPLNRADVAAVTDLALAPVVETDWKKTVSVEKGLGLGVYAQFLQLATGGLPLGPSPEVNVQHVDQRTHAFAFDSITTLAFEPTAEYVAQAIKAPLVQAWLREPAQRFAPAVSLFLVTGIKLVRGANIKYSTLKSTMVVGHMRATLGTSFGPKGRWVSVTDDDGELNREAEFVFAFRVKRLRFGRKVKVEDYNKGAFLAVGGEEGDADTVLIEDVDGSAIEKATAVPDVTENGHVYCVPP